MPNDFASAVLLADVSSLAGLNDRQFTAVIKANLRDDVRWAVMLEPALAARTRQTLTHMLQSIDAQKERAIAENWASSEQYRSWLGSISKLRGYVMARLEEMGVQEIPVSNSKEIQAWRGFSARLAAALEESDQSALDRLRTPYGGLTARQWLTARQEKKAKAQ